MTLFMTFAFNFWTDDAGAAAPAVATAAGVS